MSRFLLLAPSMRPGMKPPVNGSIGQKNARAHNRASVVARWPPACGTDWCQAGKPGIKPHCKAEPPRVKRDDKCHVNVVTPRTTGQPPPSVAWSPQPHGRDDVTPNAIEIHDLHRSFGSVRAVDGLNLTIRTGESVAVLGPNGAGKSTTIAMLLGLLAPDAGSVAVWGMPS